MPYTYDYPRPAVTVDAIIFRNIDNVSQILLIKRAQYPFEGMWAIPGGFIEMHETLEYSALRELEEETGITGVQLQQFGTYGDINRDPRHRTITVAFVGFLNDNKVVAQASDDAADCKWFYVHQLPELAFDHSLIIADAIKFANKQKWI